jgi:hypothetical protein
VADQDRQSGACSDLPSQRAARIAVRPDLINCSDTRLLQYREYVSDMLAWLMVQEVRGFGALYFSCHD